jgi:hypothetical protein
MEQAKTVYFSRKDGELPIVIDSGASYSVTPNLQDFIGPIRECSTKELNGLNALINVVGEGKVGWKIQDVFGTVRSIKTTAYYVPEASVRLFSPQIYFLKWKHGSYLMDHAGTRLTLKDGTSLTFPYNSGSSLPLMLTTKHFNRSSKFVGLTYQDGQTLGNTAHLSAFLNVADETNRNDEDDSMPGLLGRDSYDNDAESDDDEEELEFYQQRSGREVAIGEHDGFRQTRRGRQVIPPNRLGANPAYREIGFPGENMGAY